MASTTRTGAIYGIGVYGTDTYGLSNVSITVDGVDATSALDSGFSVYNSNVYPVSGTEATVLGPQFSILLRTVYRSDDGDALEQTLSVGDVTVVANANTGTSGVEATGQIQQLVDTNFDSVYDVQGVEGTGIVSTEYTDKYTGFFVYDNYINAYYGSGIYGLSYYGITDRPIYHEVDAVSATGAVGNASISADSNTQISASVFAEVITDSPLVVGDEVVVIADANVPTTAQGATATLGVFTLKTTNVFPVDTLDIVTSSIGDVTIIGKANVDVTGVVTSPAVGDVEAKGEALVETTAPALMTLTENAAGITVLNNAIPSFDSVSATAILNAVTTSTVINPFDINNRDFDRVVSVGTQESRIVYVKAA